MIVVIRNPVGGDYVGRRYRKLTRTYSQVWLHRSLWRPHILITYLLQSSTHSFAYKKRFLLTQLQKKGRLRCMLRDTGGQDARVHCGSFDKIPTRRK